MDGARMYMVQQVTPVARVHQVKETNGHGAKAGIDFSDVLGDGEMDLDDWTSYGEFTKHSAVWLLVAVEDLSTAVLSLAIFVALRLVGIGIFIFEVFVRKVVSGTFDALERVWRCALDVVVPSGQGKEASPVKAAGTNVMGSSHSAVNVTGIPYIRGYKPRDFTPSCQGKLDRLLTSDPGPVDGAYDLNLAKYFAMLSCAVYEGNKVHDELFRNLGYSDHQRVRVLHKNSCSCTIVFREVGDCVVTAVVFKGTSPFDLNEWMSDCRIAKVVDYTFLAEYGFGVSGLGVHGRVHEGFYNAFVKKVLRGDEHPPLMKILMILSRIADMAKGSGKEFKLWITGHSLGAALATMLTAFVVSPEICRERKASRVVGEKDWAKILTTLCASLTGVYTFGNPRVGDRAFADKVNGALERLRVPFRRFRNGNDIVGVVPMGTGLLAEMFRVWSMVLSRSDVMPKQNFCSISNWGEVGREYRLDYFGRPPHQCVGYPELTAYEEMKGDETVAHAYKTLFYNILSWRAQKLGADVVHSAENCVASACWVVPSAALHLLRQRWRAPLRELIGGEDSELRSALLTLLSVALMPSFVYDHIPSAYAKNIDLATREKWH